MTTRMAMRECADLERKLVIHDAIDERLWCHINEVRVRRIVPDTAEQREQLQCAGYRPSTRASRRVALANQIFGPDGAVGAERGRAGRGGGRGHLTRKKSCMQTCTRTGEPARVEGHSTMHVKWRGCGVSRSKDRGSHEWQRCAHCIAGDKDGKRERARQSMPHQ